MSLDAFIADLDALVADATSKFAAAADAAALEAARVEFLGAKSGKLKDAQKGLGAVGKDDKPAAGKKFNEVKQAIEAAFAAAQDRSTSGEGVAATGPAFDPSQPGTRHRLGHLHPLTQTIEELKDIMGRLGFTVAHGPEIEDERHNFEALNIPKAHPARDPLENFYLAVAGKVHGASVQGSGLNANPEPRTPNPELLLRSQTSTVQIRVMEAQQPPVRIISLGRVYRPDDADATHYPMFHQIEGLLIDKHVTMADLKSTLRLFAGSYFGGEVHIRFRPSFFPFTEPSVEVDMQWNDRWIEMGGAGMVDPNVLRAVGYDPEQVSGFAFGLGVERVCARRHQVTDIREFYRNDVRFLEQF
ncbi:MAG: phenylalanine--tRNA ligase subunit alpha [Planctomycetales bacterium]|nr:phenylalanine--tRNA ligase subunit alpha [Planctomycetales bacterium]MBN8623946.1 phenylalanine--tRNA ligase subunit alpha [Planctomycetota bacterium]